MYTVFTATWYIIKEHKELLHFHKSKIQNMLCKEKFVTNQLSVLEKIILSVRLPRLINVSINHDVEKIIFFSKSHCGYEHKHRVLWLFASTGSGTDD